MAYYRQLGTIPPKRHTQHRRPNGELYYEELIGEEGFSSDSSLLYHRHIPSAIVDATCGSYPTRRRCRTIRSSRVTCGCTTVPQRHGGEHRRRDRAPARPRQR